MSRLPPHVSLAADGITRRSSGLSPAHRRLIELLAAVAVENYLRECDMAEAEGTEAPADERDEVTR